MNSSAAPSRHFLPSIEGLRAVSILMVVAFHARVPGCTGGLVGVDVFFVLSGYLITRLLRREYRSTGAFDAFAFYARRVRRLLPASTLVLVLSIFGGALLCAPVLMQQFSASAFYTALYAVNIQVAVKQQAYMIGNNEINPFLQYWSLAVEEQFYLLWPLLLVVVHRFCKTRRTLLVAFVGLTFGSLLVSLAVTQRHSQIWSFYLPFTRGWEFGAGAVLAIWQEEASLPRSRWTDLLGWSSFLGLLALLPLFPADRHPGLVTLAPVMGALGCIAASGGSRFGLARLLDSRPMQWIGGLSYSWYLLHWPLLVFLQAFTIHLRWQSAVPVSVMGLGLAWLMKRYVEDPCRYRLLRFRSAKGLVAFVIFCATISCLAAFGWRLFAVNILSKPPQKALEDQRKIDGVITPCLVGFPARIPCACRLGDTIHPTQTVYLIGDSHAEEWVPPIAEVAKAEGWLLVVHAKKACPISATAIYKNNMGVRYTECEDWRDSVTREIQKTKPHLVIVASSNVESPQQWGPGVRVVLERIKGYADRILYLEDLPRGEGNHLACLSQQQYVLGRHSGDCRFPAMDPMKAAFAQSENLALAGLRIETFNLANLACPGGVCMELDRGIPVWRDGNHVLKIWTATQSDAFRRLMRDPVITRNP